MSCDPTLIILPLRAMPTWQAVLFFNMWLAQSSFLRHTGISFFVLYAIFQALQDFAADVSTTIIVIRIEV